MARDADGSKPRLRGVIHQWAAIAAVAAGVVLLRTAMRVPMEGGRAFLAAAIYAASMIVLFSVSATYHVVDWGPVGDLRMRRLDHAAIFVLIAGTYTPIALIALAGQEGTRLCAVAWGCGAVGMLRAVAWPHAPRFVATSLALVAGWCVLPFLGDIGRALDPSALTFLLAGGGLYTVGAVAYAFKKPNPVPGVFGFHEVFHAFTVAAAACHFAAVMLILRAASPE